MAPPNQSLRRRAFCLIYVGNRNVTDKLDPYLISVQVIDRVNPARGFDICNIELDDRDARLAIPQDNELISVWLGWATSGPSIDQPPIAPPPGSERQLSWGNETAYIVFHGYLSSVESGFARKGGGRRMWLEATSADYYKTAKEPMTFASGAGEEVDTNGNVVQGATEGVGGGIGTAGAGIPFRTFINGVNSKGKTGFALNISPDVANEMRDRWDQSGESFFHLLDRMAGTLNFRWKAEGKTISIFRDPTTAAFTTKTIDAHWGVNLISWRIHPFMARPQFAGAGSQWFDIVNGVLRKNDIRMDSEMPFAGAAALSRLPMLAPNRQVGDQSSNSRNTNSKIQRGQGWAIINGEPQARAASYLNIVGARPGVDGNYFIVEAEHNYIRDGGYTTRCMLEEPRLWVQDYEKMGWLDRMVPTDL